MSQREKLSKMTRPFALYVHTTSLPNIDGELPSMPLNFELPVEARAGHTSQAKIRLQEGIDSVDLLGASPSTPNSAVGRLNTGSGKGAGTLSIARREGCEVRGQREGRDGRWKVWGREQGKGRTGRHREERESG